DDVRFRARLVLEVAPDHGLEIVQRVEDREIQLRLEIERKHDTTVAIEHKRLHSAHLRGVSRQPRLVARARGDKPGKCFSGECRRGKSLRDSRRYTRKTMAYNAWFSCINGCPGEFDLREVIYRC